MCIEESPIAETHRVKIFREMVKLSERNKRRRKPCAQDCPDCKGTGKNGKNDCSSCGGTGTATDWR